MSAQLTNGTMTHPVVFAIYTVDLRDRWAEIRFWMPKGQPKTGQTRTPGRGSKPGKNDGK